MKELAISAGRFVVWTGKATAGFAVGLTWGRTSMVFIDLLLLQKVFGDIYVISCSDFRMGLGCAIRIAGWALSIIFN